ncbi:MAG: hypothetical protein LLG02_04805 [Pelosinus sp.]|nr:hypothetical protein [Pelosinus sp.]
MLRIRAALKSASSEYGQRAIFWTELCVLYVVWVNFSGLLQRFDGISANWFLLILVQIVDLVVYAGVINIAVLASSKQEYSLKDIVLRADKLGRFLVVAVIPAALVLVLSFMLAHSRGLTAALLGIVMLLTILLLFIKFSFVPFYIMGDNAGIISSIKQSWSLSSCPVAMSLILFFLAMVIAVLPLSLIDMLLASWHISIVSYITPLGLLVLGYLYQQAVQKFAKE